MLSIGGMLVFGMMMICSGNVTSAMYVQPNPGVVSVASTMTWSAPSVTLLMLNLYPGLPSGPGEATRTVYFVKSIWGVGGLMRVCDEMLYTHRPQFCCQKADHVAGSFITVTPIGAWPHSL